MIFQGVPPTPGRELHSPVIFLNLNADDLSTGQVMIMITILMTSIMIILSKARSSLSSWSWSPSSSLTSIIIIIAGNWRSHASLWTQLNSAKSKIISIIFFYQYWWSMIAKQAFSLHWDYLFSLDIGNRSSQALPPDWVKVVGCITTTNLVPLAIIACVWNTQCSHAKGL